MLFNFLEHREGIKKTCLGTHNKRVPEQVFCLLNNFTVSVKLLLENKKKKQLLC